MPLIAVGEECVVRSQPRRGMCRQQRGAVFFEFVADRQRYRLRFSKRDRLRFVSHRDLLQVFQRALRRAGLKVSHTQGFNPHPKLTFALALPLGVESWDEVLDIELDESPQPEEVATRLGACLPPGLEIHRCERVEGKGGFAVLGGRYEVPLEAKDAEVAAVGIARFNGDERPMVVRERKGRVREIPLREFVSGLVLDGSVLRFDLLLSEGSGMKPDELLQWLGLDPVRQRVVKRESLLSAAE